MAGKGKKKRNSKDSTSGGQKKKVKKKSRSKSAKIHGDILSDAAIENSYYICHNIQDVLKRNGYAWPEDQKKKKKKGKR